MQGLKKIEEIFAQERKVVDDLLDIAKVFCILNLWNPMSAVFMCCALSVNIHISVHNLGCL